MSFSRRSPELQDLCMQYLADEKFHKSFMLPPSRITTRTTATRVTYCDVGCTHKSDGSVNNAVVLFCGGMFAGRWLGSMLDGAASKYGVRLISLDRSGMGGTPSIELNYRMQTWLEIVPALLKHLGLRHVALVSHSAGTLYLLNTILNLRHLLHPTQPYAAMIAPWIHHSNTASVLMNLTNFAPQFSISHFHHLTSFMMTSFMPSIGPMVAFSGNVAAKVGSSFPSPAQKSDATTWVLQPGTATIEEAKQEREMLSDLRVKYVMAEGVSGASQEALLCLKRPISHWGSWENYDTLVPILVDSEHLLRERQDWSSRSRNNLQIDVFYAENDKLTNGRKGAAWFDQCWREELRQGVIDFKSTIVPNESHDSVIDPDLIGGPIERIFMQIATNSKLEPRHREPENESSSHGRRLSISV